MARWQQENRKPFANPFFLYFMVCATLRWQWQGVLWSSVAALTIFVGLGIHSASASIRGMSLRDPAFELNCFLTRAVYLVIAAVMLDYLSTYEGEVRIALAAQDWSSPSWRPRARPSLSSFVG